MKALVSLVLAVGIIGGVYLATTSGCGARAQVAGDKILDMIDSRLGELDVKMKKVQNEMAELDKIIASNREGKIKAEVRLEEFDKKIKPLENDIKRAKQALKILNPHLTATSDVEINGKMRAPAEINEMATALLDEHESLSSSLGTLKATRRQFEQAHQAVARNYDVSTRQMAELKKMVGMIESKKEALDENEGCSKYLERDRFGIG